MLQYSSTQHSNLEVFMFIGRETELVKLNKLYSTNQFEMAVMLG